MKVGDFVRIKTDNLLLLLEVEVIGSSGLHGKSQIIGSREHPKDSQVLYNVIQYVEVTKARFDVPELKMSGLKPGNLFTINHFHFKSQFCFLGNKRNTLNVKFVYYRVDDNEFCFSNDDFSVTKI